MSFPISLLVIVGLLPPFTQTAYAQLSDSSQAIKTRQPDSAQIPIRMISRSTLQTGNEPLHIVDGVSTTQAQALALNPNRIKKIRILKDAQATAIYGSRGAKGAIIITTKRRFKTKR